MVEKKKTSRYSPEFRERAVRLLDEHRSDYPSLSAARREIGGKLGCSGDSLHDWWKPARRDAGAQPGPTTAETARITVGREELEERVLTGLKKRLLAPEAAAEAMRAYVEETNRLNHERRASISAWKTELGKIEKGVKGIFDAIENGLYDEGIKQRLGELRQREQELRASLKDADDNTLDIHPQVAEIFRQKVERLAASLNDPEDRPEATQALRALIEKIVITPGRKRGESFAVLHGELGRILRFTAQKGAETTKARANAGPLWNSVVAGAGLLLSLQKSQVESKAGLKDCFIELFSAHA